MHVLPQANRAMLEHNREMLSEMRASRTARGRPQVVVEAGYAHLPMVDIIVRNVESAWVKDQNVLIENGNITGYKVNLAIVFVLEEGEQPA
jgi:hypothetical protein